MQTNDINNILDALLTLAHILSKWHLLQHNFEFQSTKISYMHKLMTLCGNQYVKFNYITQYLPKIFIEIQNKWESDVLVIVKFNRGYNKIKFQYYNTTWNTKLSRNINNIEMNPQAHDITSHDKAIIIITSIINEL